MRKKLPEKIDFHAKFSAIFEVKIANIFTKRKNLWKMRENEKNAKKNEKRMLDIVDFLVQCYL